MKSAIVLVAILLTACASTLPAPETETQFQRAKPVDDMQKCKVDVCRLPTWFEKADPDLQAAIELNCKIVNDYYARDCAKKQSHLADYINGEQDQKH